AIGTVQATCLPAFSAARLCGAWSGIGELMWTASTFESRSSSLKSVYRFLMPNFSPQASSSALLRRQMAYISALGGAWGIGMNSAPKPRPTMATRIFFVDAMDASSSGDEARWGVISGDDARNASVETISLSPQYRGEGSRRITPSRASRV